MNCNILKYLLREVNYVVFFWHGTNTRPDLRYSSVISGPEIPPNHSLATIDLKHGQRISLTDKEVDDFVSNKIATVHYVKLGRTYYTLNTFSRYCYRNRNT